VTAVDELKEPEVEKSDYIDEDTNNMDKLRLSKNRPRLKYSTAQLRSI
jgi:hypothetical protein